MAFRTKVLNNNSSGSLVFTWLARTSTELCTLFLGKPGIGNLAIIMNKPWGEKTLSIVKKCYVIQKCLGNTFAVTSDPLSSRMKVKNEFGFLQTRKKQIFHLLFHCGFLMFIRQYSLKRDLNKPLAFSLSLISSTIEYSTKSLLPFRKFC